MNTTCNETFATPAVYMAERPEGYDITFEIPGAGKDDVDLHVDGRTLRLRTTKKPAEKPAGFREAVREFDPDANCAVTVDLPELADPATAKTAEICTCAFCLQSIPYCYRLRAVVKQQ